MKRIKSAYIHIPFCKNICSYCDFCKMYYDEALVNSYLDALELEIIKNYRQEKLETIYIGGGTPSSLNTAQLDKLFEIINKINKSDNCEMTFECNVDDIDEKLLLKLQDNGINRISIGVETINEKFFSLINRYNDQDLVKNKIALVKNIFKISISI